MTKNRMFEFITRTRFNPIGGRCPHNCIYCWSMGKTGLVNRYGLKKYLGSICLIEKELNQEFKEGDFVFVQDMSDLFADCIPREYILKVFETIKKNPKTKFLLLTKNPKRYMEFLNDFPSNVVLGATIESDCDYPEISKAPVQGVRMSWMLELASKTKLPLFISIEPILDFDYIWFSSNIMSIKQLWAVAIGYDNYNNYLPEPKLKKTEYLIKVLEEKEIKVYRKTLREAWNEK